MQLPIYNFQGVTRVGEPQERGPELPCRRKGLGAAERQDPENGQSLFELVVAIAISALIITALVSLTTNSIQNSTFSKNKTLSATYVQEASEWLRGQRDGDTNTFVTNAELSVAKDPKTLLVTWCLTDLSWSNPGPCSETDFIPGTPFIRQVTFGAKSGGVFEVDVSVSWQDSQGFHEVKSATDLAGSKQQ